MVNEPFITEADDKLLTEEGDNLVTEESTPAPASLIGLVPIRYLVGVTANVVPVETVGAPGIGIVNCTVMTGPANVVPVRESLEIPRMLIFVS